MAPPQLHGCTAKQTTEAFKWFADGRALSLSLSVTASAYVCACVRAYVRGP